MQSHVLELAEAKTVQDTSVRKTSQHTSSIDGSVVCNQVGLDASALHALKNLQSVWTIIGSAAEHGHQACVKEGVMSVKNVARVLFLHPFKGLESFHAMSPLVQIWKDPASKANSHSVVEGCMLSVIDEKDWVQSSMTGKTWAVNTSWSDVASESCLQEQQMVLQLLANQLVV